MSVIMGRDAVAIKSAPSSGYLYGPVMDFFLLGGGSIAGLILVAALWPMYSNTALVSTVMLYLANVINHPHFAHSYQLFYRNFRRRAFGDEFPDALRARYLFAAIVVPLLLILFFAYCIMTSDVSLLGFGANLMFFLVGWHYVKQGYGMLMVDSVLKRSFFSEREKRVLLWNAYMVWITSWVQANNIFHNKSYWEISYYTFPFSDGFLHVLYGLLAATTLVTLWVAIRKWRNSQSKAFPFNGMMAYLVSLYLWLLIWNPAMLLVIPAFHSLQYLAVVWKYRVRMERADVKNNPGLLFASKGVMFRFGIFIAVGFILGYLGFWAVPEGLDGLVNYDRSVFGGSLFLFLFWIFINVHHYFLDNVMWRRDNPDTKKYLFGA